jgi:hypothetical protein
MAKDAVGGGDESPLTKAENLSFAGAKVRTIKLKVIDDFDEDDAEIMREQEGVLK